MFPYEFKMLFLNPMLKFKPSVIEITVLRKSPEEISVWRFRTMIYNILPLLSKHKIPKVTNVIFLFNKHKQNQWQHVPLTI